MRKWIEDEVSCLERTTRILSDGPAERRALYSLIIIGKQRIQQVKKKGGGKHRNEKKEKTHRHFDTINATQKGRSAFVSIWKPLLSRVDVLVNSAVEIFNASSQSRRMRPARGISW